MMQAPDALSLHDIVLPEPVSRVPQTVGWWVLLALALVIVIWLAVRVFRSRRANRYRRLALSRLQAIESALTDPARRSRALAELPVLLKQTALAAAQRTQVAPLSGEPWLEFLDSSYGGRGFSQGAGRLVPKLAYGKPEETATLGEEVITPLVELVRLWIRSHDVRV